MNNDMQTRMLISALRVEKVSLENQIQRAGRSSERLSRYDKELSETEAEIMAYRKRFGVNPVDYDTNGNISKLRPKDKNGIDIPLPITERLYLWFSGRH